MSSKSCSPHSIVFFGTSAFAAHVLEQLLARGHPILAIVTRPDRLQGRRLEMGPPPVKEAALRLAPHIPLFQPLKASSAEFASSLVSADFFVVVAYGEIIKQNLLSMPRLGCINIHASLLPSFRGAAPMQRALMAGCHETGITIIEMTPQMDAGDILAQEAIPIPESMTLGELEALLRPLAVRLVCDVIEGTAVKIPQDPTQVTLAPKLTPEEERIDWSRSAAAIHNQVRALSPLPGAWCQLRLGETVKRLKIKRSRVCLPDQKGWVVACSEGFLELLEVQLEGKKEMSAAECLRGLHNSFYTVT